MLHNAHILVADDEHNGRRMLEIILTNLGFHVTTAVDGVDALEILRNNAIDLLITDLMMPKMDGLALLAALRQEDIVIPSIVVTAYGTVENAVAAMKQGAFDFIVRPLDVEQINMVVTHALENYRVKQENAFLRDQLDNDGLDEFVGQSSVMHDIYDLIKKVAPSRAGVFISGETGTGKELVASAIHRYSGRSGLFVPINCAAIPTNILESELFGYVRGAFTGAHKDRVGKFELAHNGTLFLDEITEMRPDLQAKLLRVLQENVVERIGSNRSVGIDSRIIAATNRNPRDAVKEGSLREDVFYRLNVFNINLPALRNRGEDILLLANNFIERYRKQMAFPPLQLSTAACESLNRYHWPGNVRELENVMERAVVLSHGGKIDEEHLPQEIFADVPQTGVATVINRENGLEDCVATLEMDMISEALQFAEGNKSKAARSLKISERTLWYKLKKYHMSGVRNEDKSV